MSTIFFSILTFPFHTWSYYISVMLRDFSHGKIGVASILIAVALAFLLIDLIRCIGIVIVSKAYQTKSYFMRGCIASGILLLLAVPFSILGIASFVSLPTLILCFAEHLATKQLRNDRRWLITRVSQSLSQVFPGQSTGMAILGILGLLCGLLMAAFSKAQSANLLMLYFPPVTWGIFLFMGLLAKKK